jgi:hypothetical protein
MRAQVAKDRAAEEVRALEALRYGNGRKISIGFYANWTARKTTSLS